MIGKRGIFILFFILNVDMCRRGSRWSKTWKLYKCGQGDSRWGRIYKGPARWIDGSDRGWARWKCGVG